MNTNTGGAKHARRNAPSTDKPNLVPPDERKPNTYYTGDGELGQVYGCRPGANDHAQYKSFGYRT